MKCCCLSVHPSVCRIAQQRLSDRHAVRTEWRAVESRVGVDDARTCSSYSSCTVRAWWPVIAATNASSVTGELTARWMRLAGWLESHLKPREIRTTSGLTSLHHNYCSSSSSKRWILTVCDALQWVTCQWHYHRLMCVVCSWLTSLQYNTHTHTHHHHHSSDWVLTSQALIDWTLYWLHIYLWDTYSFHTLSFQSWTFGWLPKILHAQKWVTVLRTEINYRRTWSA